MKWILPYLLLPILLATGFHTCALPPAPEVEEPTPIVDAGPQEPEIEETADVPCQPVDRRTMVAEVVEVWEMFFDDEGAKWNDPRRARFEDHANDLVDMVIMYQNHPTDIGGQLPCHINDHILVATLVTKESSVTYNVVGRSHQEVGLLQVHGKALAGYSRETVKHNPRLGLMLGTRWLASQIQECPIHRVEGDNTKWRDSDWFGPLSVYAGGYKAKNRKTGKCYTYRIAKERVSLTKLYRSRINANDVG
jgi:hypothetical protein